MKRTNGEARDTHFPTTTPKFIMGGVGPNVRWIANGPGYGAGTWEKPRGQYGVAQLTPWLVFPPDGLNLKQGTCGELFGYGYRWNEQMTRNNGSLLTLPEYYRLDSDGKKPQWSVVLPKHVPPELGLTQYRFEIPKEKPQEPRTTPDHAASCWKKPGPAAGPFKARRGDGRVVTHYWYRFADQPAMLNADLTPDERELVQKRVEMLHRTWTKERTCLAPPDVGTLASLDPALIVNPPRGMEAGYVPIATRQELE